MFQTKVLEKIKTYILYSINIFRKSWRVWDDVEKYFSARRTADGNITRRMCVQCWITKAANTLRICNNYCFSTSIIVTRMHLNVTLYVASFLIYTFINSPTAKRRKRILKFIKVHFRYFPRNNGYYFVSIKKIWRPLALEPNRREIFRFRKMLIRYRFFVCTEPNFRSGCLSISQYSFLLADNINIVLVKTFFSWGH
jgi:hypothetical protein